MRLSPSVKKAALIVPAILLLALALAYMSGAFREKIAPEQLTPARRTLGDAATDVVHRIIQTEQVAVVGTLRAERRTQVAARIMAAIVEINVRAGDRVAKGDVLARLDDRDLKAEVDRATQVEAAAKATLEKAQKDYDRTKNLHSENVASNQELDQREADRKVAQAKLREASEAKSTAEILLSYATIKAPVGGVVIDKYANAGDTTTPGRPLLDIYDPSALRLEAAVPEASAAGLKVGDVLELRLDMADSPSPIKGTVEEIVPQAETASRSVLVKVRLPESIPGAAGGRLVPGTFGRLFIPGRERVRLCLPLSAVRSAGQLRFVDVVKEDNTLERRQVVLGEHSRFGRVEALSGLEGDERIVLYGPPPEPLPPDVKFFPTRDDE